MEQVIRMCLVVTNLITYYFNILFSEMMLLMLCCVINYKLKFESHFRHFIFTTAAKNRNSNIWGQTNFL